MVLRWGAVSTSPNHQAGGPPLVCFPRLLIQYIRSYPPYWRPFFHGQPVDASCLGKGTRLPRITAVCICYLQHVQPWWKDIHKQCSAGTYIDTRNMCTLNWLSAAFTGLCRVLSVPFIQTFLDISDNSRTVPNFITLSLPLLANSFVIKRRAICFFFV